MELTAEQRIAYAVQGLERIGIAGARRHDAQAHAVNIKFSDITDRKYGGHMPASAPELAEWKAQDRALWGSSRREQRAYDVVAYWVTGVLGRRQAAMRATLAAA